MNVHEYEFSDAIVDNGRVFEGLSVDRIRLDGSVDDALELDYCVDLPEESLIFVTTIFEAHRLDFSHLLRSYKSKYQMKHLSQSQDKRPFFMLTLMVWEINGILIELSFMLRHEWSITWDVRRCAWLIELFLSGRTVERTIHSETLCSSGF